MHSARPTSAAVPAAHDPAAVAASEPPATAFTAAASRGVDDAARGGVAQGLAADANLALQSLDGCAFDVATATLARAPELAAALVPPTARRDATSGRQLVDVRRRELGHILQHALYGTLPPANDPGLAALRDVARAKGLRPLLAALAARDAAAVASASRALAARYRISSYRPRFVAVPPSRRALVEDIYAAFALQVDAALALTGRGGDAASGPFAVALQHAALARCAGELGSAVAALRPPSCGDGDGGVGAGSHASCSDAHAAGAEPRAVQEAFAALVRRLQIGDATELTAALQHPPGRTAGLCIDLRFAL